MIPSSASSITVGGSISTLEYLALTSLALGSSKPKRASELMKYDIVLTTFQVRRYS